MPDSHAQPRRPPPGRAASVPMTTQEVPMRRLAHTRNLSQEVADDWTQKEPTSPTLNQNTNFSFAIKNNMDYYVGSSQAGPFVVASFAPKTSKKKPEEGTDALAGTPYEVRQGRRYLRDSSYMLPCDLPELHRQSMSTMLAVSVLGGPLCSPSATTICPRKVLELGCGSAFWTSTCHDYFKSRDRHDISFVGLDMAPLAPDISRHGVEWTFVPHDLRKFPWPFEDEEFDFIMVKDMGLAVPSHARRHLVEECLRILCTDGNIEFWDSVPTLTSLSSSCDSVSNGADDSAREQAASTATYLLDEAELTTPAQASLIKDFNLWMKRACDVRQMSLDPLSDVTKTLASLGQLTSVGSCRVGIPLFETSWEKARVRTSGDGLPTSGASEERYGEVLSSEQAAIRTTAVTTFLQRIESLEPILLEASGKNSEEWASWWSDINTYLLAPRGQVSGDCIVIGAAWATKC